MTALGDIVVGKRWLTAAAIGCLAPLADCAPAPMSYLVSDGAASRPVVSLGWGLLAISCLVMLIIAALLAWAIWRRRPAGARDAQGRQEIARGPNSMRWIYIGVGISTVVLFGSTVWTLTALAQVMSPPRHPPVTLQVTAHDWWWEIRYLGATPSRTFITANDIHIPVGSPVRVELNSDGVIHSFWAPRLAGKMDVIPGRTNITWIQADRPGVYRGQCAEYCGLQHAHMVFKVIAQSPQDFHAWWDGQLRPPRAVLNPSATLGAQVFQARCGACHAIRGGSADGVIGPDLSHLAQRGEIAAGTLPNDRDSLDAWLRDPQMVKPGALMPKVPMTSAERGGVIAYLQSLN